MKMNLLCVLGLLIAIGAARAADPCGSLNFFPTAAQITGATGAAASVAVNAETTCRGSQVCNWPSVVNKTAQESYQADLGTSVAAGGLLSVAVKEYGARQLKVFFRPVSPLLTQNANAMSCVLAKTVAATRRLSQTSSYTVTNPGTWSYTASLSSAGSLGGGERTAVETGDITISTEGMTDDRNYCATISVVLKGYTVSGAPAGFPAQITLPFTVCFYKHNGQATAKFNFGACGAGGGYTVNVSAVAPLAQNITQAGDDLLNEEGNPHLLIQPVVQIFGRMNRTLQGEPIEEGASFVNKYFLLPTDMKAGDIITLSLDEGELPEGFYHMSAKISVVTKFPNLVDLQGPARINQTDIEEIMGYTEYMGFLVRNGTDDETPLLGLQSSTRMPQISDISVDKESTSIKAGDAITFSWQFVAAGKEKCYHDGVEILTDPCVSPMVVKAKAFSANATRHNFSVAITDVCGNIKHANFSYGPDGAKPESEIDYVDPTTMDDGTTGLIITGNNARRTVSAAAPVTTAAGLIKSTAAAFVASILLMGLLV